ncbi:MAG: SDR family NAD(P)-dependent oxidoreductase [Lachnospiraceae bacterium]|nr:SDR family NAD(P)-dependent oxidoreductase [Lachnospiraceae bacterium]
MENILITGASRGIGRAIALRLAGRNCNLFINSSGVSQQLEETEILASEIKRNASVSGNVFRFKADVSDPSAVREMFGYISGKTAGGNIDILVNNAGISHIGLVQDVTDDIWDRMIGVNLSSVHYCCRAAVPHMIAHGRGRIINISSVWGCCGASCEVAYSASKGGVNAYTKALAKELAPSGIAVNAIACGCIDTGMNDHLNAAEKEELCASIPAGRFSSADEVAELVDAMCDQSLYLTGQIIGFDGGWI